MVSPGPDHRGSAAKVSEGALIAAELAAADPSLAGAVLLAGTATPGSKDIQVNPEDVDAAPETTP
jgi:hypothetical protein